MDRSVPSKSSETDESLPTIFNQRRLSALVGGDMDLLANIAGLFLDFYPAILSDMKDAVSRNDVQAFARAIQSLKGSGRSFLTEFADEIVIELELLVKGNALSEAQPRLIELEGEVDRINAELSRLAAGYAADQHG